MYTRKCPYLNCLKSNLESKDVRLGELTEKGKRVVHESENREAKGEQEKLKEAGESFIFSTFYEFRKVFSLNLKNFISSFFMDSPSQQVISFFISSFFMDSPSQ